MTEIYKPFIFTHVT